MLRGYWATTEDNFNSSCKVNAGSPFNFGSGGWDFLTPGGGCDRILSGEAARIRCFQKQEATGFFHEIIAPFNFFFQSTARAIAAKIASENKPDPRRYCP